MSTGNTIGQMIVSQNNFNKSILIEDASEGIATLLGLPKSEGKPNLLDYFDSRTRNTVEENLDFEDECNDFLSTVRRLRFIKIRTVRSEYIAVKFAVDQCCEGGNAPLLFRVNVSCLSLGDQLNQFMLEFNNAEYLHKVCDLSVPLNHLQCIEALEMCKDFLVAHKGALFDFTVCLLTPIVEDAHKFRDQLAEIVDTLIGPEDILGYIYDDGVLLILLDDRECMPEKIYDHMCQMEKPVALSYTRLSGEASVLDLIEQLCQELTASYNSDEVIELDNPPVIARS